VVSVSSQDPELRNSAVAADVGVEDASCCGHARAESAGSSFYGQLTTSEAAAQDAGNGPPVGNSTGVEYCLEETETQGMGSQVLSEQASH
jgi:hypothetical protein